MTEIAIEKNRPLAELTTFRIGGTADLFCEPSGIEELIGALGYVDKNRCRYYILGGGSNTLFSDAGFRGLVISMRKFRGISREGQKVRVLAGTPMDALNDFCSREGLSGLEFSGGLPGSAGGAAVMNARAYGGEMSEVVDSVTVYRTGEDKQTLSRNEIGYAYKKSVFMDDPSLVIAEIVFSLKASDPEKVRALTEQNRNDREDKGQYVWPSAGCVFKNDRSAGMPSGQLIDFLGLKGKKIGGAQVYDRHANFIVNTGGAKAEDVVRLLEKIENEVLKKKGVRLERELRVIE